MRYFVEFTEHRQGTDGPPELRRAAKPYQNETENPIEHAEVFSISWGITPNSGRMVEAAAIIDPDHDTRGNEVIASYPISDIRLPPQLCSKLLEWPSREEHAYFFEVDAATGKALHSIAQLYLDTLGLKLAPRIRTHRIEGQKSRGEHIAEIERKAKSRLGQSAFRSSLLRAFGRRCAISGCRTVEALSAAHIFDYSKSNSQAVWNGLLLRADLHLLFDLHLLRIYPGTRPVVVLTPELQNSKTYGKYHNKKLRLPEPFDEKRTNAELLIRWNAANEVHPGFQPPQGKKQKPK